jgi:hypothetical protein
MMVDGNMAKINKDDFIDFNIEIEYSENMIKTAPNSRLSILHYGSDLLQGIILIGKEVVDT